MTVAYDVVPIVPCAAGCRQRVLSSVALGMPARLDVSQPGSHDLRHGIRIGEALACLEAGSDVGSATDRGAQRRSRVRLKPGADDEDCGPLVSHDPTVRRDASRTRYGGPVNATSARSAGVGSMPRSRASTTRYCSNARIASDWLPSARCTRISAAHALSRNGSARIAARAAATASPN